MFSVREDEKTAIKEWEVRHNVKVTTVSEDLSLANVDLVEGFDGLSIQQVTELPEEAIYKKLASFGIKQISLRTAGYDIINSEMAKKYKLTITNVPAYSPRSVAELVLTQTMRLIRHFPALEAHMAHGDFRWRGLVAREIHTLTIGIIGAGKIGSAAARLFHALGAEVIAYDPVRREELEDILTYKDSQREVLEAADVISLHVPLDPSTLQIIDAEALSQMKPEAYIINAARGPVVDTQALIKALDSGKIAGAALDTLTNEQGIFNQDVRNQELPEDFKRLMEMDNVLITPHIGFYTTEAVRNMVDIGLDNTVAILLNGTSKNEVFL
ncbi:MAG: D-2-hydroxyacid dehydrogenase [Alkalibacterium sp.]|nr:D-2-hydroxyacid dehydrogenase [Alkalibacterium sp.]